jgi:transposase
MATRIDISLADLHQLQERIDCRQLEEQDWAVFGALVSKLIERTEARLASLRDRAAERAEVEPGNDVGRSAEAEDTAATVESALAREIALEGAEPEQAGGTGEPARESTQQEPPKKGHGRNGADAFVNATEHVHALADGIIGAICAACGKATVSPYRDKVIVRVVGQPSFHALRHQFQQGRCRLCGAIVTAEGRELLIREGVGSSYIIYDWSACAMLIVMHYFAGAPFKRIEALHQAWGVPMPDANQWRLADTCDDRLVPLCRALERHGIQNAISLRFDDTGSMIIELRRQIQMELQLLALAGESAQHVRTGINASGFYIETEEAKVILFFTGRHHAGEMLDRLFEHRTTAGGNKLVALTDAASKNFSHGHADQLEQAVCNAHCYLKFRAVKQQFPAESAVAGEVYQKVFDNDDTAKALGLDDHERMLYHREHSKPQMLRLLQMCKDKAEAKLVEPNSALWEPISYVINQWPLLTKFYQVPAVPLDSNLVEQTLIIPVRYLAGSFAYKTQTGADVGDRFMSLIATANANGVEPVAYLAECLRNHEDLAKRPDYYLPWVYRDRIEKLDTDPQTQARTPSSPSPPPSQRAQHPLRPGSRRALPASGSPNRHPTGLGTARHEDGRAHGGAHNPYATLLHSSGNEQREGSPPQIST